MSLLLASNPSLMYDTDTYDHWTIGAFWVGIVCLDSPVSNKLQIVKLFSVYPQ